MTLDPDRILEQALGLRPIERAELVERILASFEFPSRAEIDAAWGSESEDRVDAFERGDIKSVPADQVFDEVDRHKPQ